MSLEHPNIQCSPMFIEHPFGGRTKQSSMASFSSGLVFKTVLYFLETWGQPDFLAPFGHHPAPPGQALARLASLASPWLCAQITCTGQSSFSSVTLLYGSAKQMCRMIFLPLKNSEPEYLKLHISSDCASFAGPQWDMWVKEAKSKHAIH